LAERLQLSPAQPMRVLVFTVGLLECRACKIFPTVWRGEWRHIIMMNIMFFDGVETQERSEIKDHGISDKVMYFSALRKEI
jgi:hypothetical protein